MGLFSNPLGHAGYPPGVTGTPETQPSAVRAATSAEVTAGVLNDCYVSPQTLADAAIDFDDIVADSIQVTGQAGVSVAVPSVSGASPLVNNSRSGFLSYSDTIPASSYITVVLTNSLITPSSAILTQSSNTTVNAAPIVIGVTCSAGSVSFRMVNAGPAATTGPLNIAYWIMN